MVNCSAEFSAVQFFTFVSGNWLDLPAVPACCAFFITRRMYSSRVAWLLGSGVFNFALLSTNGTGGMYDLHCVDMITL